MVNCSYGELYRAAREALLPGEGDNASFLARELLSFASGRPAAAVMADTGLIAPERTCEAMQVYTARVLRGEPLAYILGKWSFYGMELTVTPDVLIPRDDTMAVTELAIDAVRSAQPPQRVLDLCTGSGCIGLAIARQVPTARVTLADLSDRALAVARKNMAAQRFGARVSAYRADAMQPAPVFWGKFDVIVSNPPYVSAQEMRELDSSVRDYEPRMALFGGEDGLDFYRAIIRNFTPALREGGWLCFEFGWKQAESVGALLREAGFTELRFARDSGDIVRAVAARLPQPEENKTNV